MQSCFQDVANRWMKEAGPKGAVGFKNGGDPGSIAARGDRLREAKLNTEVMRDAPEFLRTLRDEAVAGKMEDLLIESSDLIGSQSE